MQSPGPVPPAILLAACLAAGPALGQGVVAEYEAAARMFSLPGEYLEVEACMQAAEERVVALTGIWAPMYILAPGQEVVPDMEAELPRWCEGLSFRVAPTGPRSFEIVTQRNGADIAYAVRYQYIAARTYQRSVDEMAALERLGLVDAEARIQFNSYVNPATFGEVEVFQPSANVMVIQAAGEDAEIYVRCP
jgi:hypothetical protein